MRRLKPYLLLALALFVAGVMIAEEAFAADWFNEDWLYRKAITVQAGQVIGGPHVDFPMLVSLTSDADLAAKAQTNGGDILFTSSNGISKLSHEIEYYNSGTLVAWVRIPAPGINDGTIIYMYYGDTDYATNGDQWETDGSTWDSNFTAIQHLNETSGPHSDSTSNGSDSTVVNVTPQGSASGQIDGADGFDGIDDQVLLNTRFTFGPPQLITDTTGTIEAWVKPTGSPASEPTDVWRLPPVIGDLDGSLGIHRGSLGGQDRIWVYKYDTNQDVIGISYNVDEWVHIVWVHENGNLHAYKNGQEVAGSPILSGDTAWSNWVIFGTSNLSSNSFNGLIDEVRTSNTDRSAGWIQTVYNNQNAPDDFLTVSEQVSIPTMTEWGMIIFMVLAGLGSIYYMRRKRRAES